MAYLEVHNLTKRYGDFVAVDKVSFTGDKGEFITLLGPSGCGKTTLLKSLGGFISIDEGKILLDGSEITLTPPEYRDTAMCFQSYALFPHLTVEKNVAFGLEQKKLPRDEILQRLSEVLEQVAMENQRPKLPHQLSGGQQQRVALARAMIMQPGLILFDEPLSNLDAKLREKVRFEIRSLQTKMGYTSIYVTHDQSEALALSDKIIVLNKGIIQQVGEPEEVYCAPINSFVADFIGIANIMKARIKETQGTLYKVETALGLLEIESSREPVGEHVLIGWRPEHIVLDKPSMKTNIIRAEVSQKAFLGNIYHFLINSNTEIDPITLEISQKYRYNEGDRIEFSILRDKIFFLEASDG